MTGSGELEDGRDQHLPVGPAQAKTPIRQVAQATPLGQLPTMPPFPTAGQMMDHSTARMQYETQLRDLDSALDQMRADHQYQKKQINKTKREAKADTTWDMAARGLQASSIKDGALYDIDATATIRKNYLDQQMDAAVLEADRRQDLLGEWWRSMELGYNQQQVENAQQVQPAVPPQAQAQAPAPAQETSKSWRLSRSFTRNGKRYYRNANGTAIPIDDSGNLVFGSAP